MKTIYSLTAYEQMMLSLTSLLTALLSGNYDVESFATHCSQINDAASTILGFKSDINSTRQDNLLAEATAKEEKLVHIERSAAECLAACRDILVNRVLKISSSDDTFCYFLQTFSLVRGYSYEMALEFTMGEILPAVLKHVSRKYLLDVSERCFPGYGMFTLMKRHKAAVVRNALAIDDMSYISDEVLPRTEIASCESSNGRSVKELGDIGTTFSSPHFGENLPNTWE